MGASVEGTVELMWESSGIFAEGQGARAGDCAMGVLVGRRNEELQIIYL
jgi:hypothetical protein